MCDPSLMKLNTEEDARLYWLIREQPTPIPKGIVIITKKTDDNHFVYNARSVYYAAKQNQSFFAFIMAIYNDTRSESRFDNMIGSSHFQKGVPSQDKRGRYQTYLPVQKH